MAAALITLLVLLSLTGCGFNGITRQPGKQADIKLEIIDFPQVVQRQKTATFVLKTAPQNRCRGGVGYEPDNGTRWTTVNFPEVVANEEGVCQWDWTVPAEAKAGTAEFRVAVYQDRDSKDIIPYQFCIETCPDDLP